MSSVIVNRDKMYGNYSPDFGWMTPFNVMTTTRDSKEYVSMSRMIPFSEENLEYARNLAQARYKCSRSDIRVRWRNADGGRKHNPQHNVKSEATHFDVYFSPRKKEVPFNNSVYSTDMFGHIIGPAIV